MVRVLTGFVAGLLILVGLLFLQLDDTKEALSAAESNVDSLDESLAAERAATQILKDNHISELELLRDRAERREESIDTLNQRLNLLERAGNEDECIDRRMPGDVISLF